MDTSFFFQNHRPAVACLDTNVHLHDVVEFKVLLPAQIILNWAIVTIWLVYSVIKVHYFNINQQPYELCNVIAFCKHVLTNSLVDLTEKVVNLEKADFGIIIFVIENRIQNPLNPPLWGKPFMAY